MTELSTFPQHTRDSVSDSLEKLHDKNDYVRGQAIRSLNGVLEQQIFDALLVVMLNENESLWCRYDAIEALDLYDFPTLLDGYQAILSVEGLGIMAAYRLGGKPDSRAQDILLEALLSDDKNCRLAAAHGVKERGNIRALLPLCMMLTESSDCRLREVAAESLAAIWLRLRDSNDCPLMSEFHAHISTHLVRAATDESLQVRGHALQLLANMGEAFVVGLISKELCSLSLNCLNENSTIDIYSWDYDFFRDGLLPAIARVGVSPFRKLLAALLALPNWRIRMTAAQVLIAADDSDAKIMLIKSLNSEDQYVRIKAAELLFCHGDSCGWEVLLKCLSEDGDYEESWFVKNVVIRQLSSCGDNRVAELFIDILENPEAYFLDGSVIGEIITNLAEWGDTRAIRPLKKWLYKDVINLENCLVERAFNHLSRLESSS